MQRLPIAPEPLDPDADAEDFRAVRQLIFGGADLPEAFRTHSAQGPHKLNELSQALRPSLKLALRDEIREEKEQVARLLFPVMGPAIRKSISASIQSFFDSVSLALSRSNPFTRLSWWLESKRSGLPMEQVAMIRNANYAVHELFLMQHDSGLLMQHASLAGETAERDPQLISGMFIAIQNFVRESFVEGAQQEDELNRMRVGETDVLVETGPFGVLAACVKGTPPPNFREAMQITLEQIHQRCGDELEVFDGDPEATAKALPIMQRLLVDRRRANKRRSALMGWLLALLLGAAAVGIWHWRGLESERWAALLTEVESAPGVEVVFSRLGWFGSQIHVLRDPQSTLNAENLLQTHDFSPNRVVFRETPFLDPRLAAERERLARIRHGNQLAALESATAAERADLEAEMRRERERFHREQEVAKREADFSGLRRMLGPNPDVNLTLDGRTVVASGETSQLWAERLQVGVAYFSELSGPDVTELKIAEIPEWERIVAELASTYIPFISGLSTPNAQTEAALEETRQNLERLAQLSRILERAYEVEIVALPLIAENQVYEQKIQAERLTYAKTWLHEAGLEDEIAQTTATDPKPDPNGQRGLIIRLKIEKKRQ